MNKSSSNSRETARPAKYHFLSHHQLQPIKGEDKSVAVLVSPKPSVLSLNASLPFADTSSSSSAAIAEVGSIFMQRQSGTLARMQIPRVRNTLSYGMKMKKVVKIIPPILPPDATMPATVPTAGSTYGTSVQSRR